MIQLFIPCKAIYTTIKLSSVNWNRFHKNRLNTRNLLTGNLTYNWCFKLIKNSPFNYWPDWHRARWGRIGTLNSCTCFSRSWTFVYGWFNCLRLYWFLISWDWLNSRWLDRNRPYWLNLQRLDWNWLHIIGSFWFYSDWLDIGRFFRQWRNFCISFCIIISILHYYWFDCFWFV